MKARRAAFEPNSLIELKSLLSIMHPPFDTHTPQPMNYGLNTTFERCSLLVNDKSILYLLENND